jgi:hypothetical protein
MLEDRALDRAYRSEQYLYLAFNIHGYRAHKQDCRVHSRKAELVTWATQICCRAEPATRVVLVLATVVSPFFSSAGVWTSFILTLCQCRKIELETKQLPDRRREDPADVVPQQLLGRNLNQCFRCLKNVFFLIIFVFLVSRVLLVRDWFATKEEILKFSIFGHKFPVNTWRHYLKKK